MQTPFAGRSVRTTLGATRVQVFVRDNNVDQALRVLKKKMQREGVFREMRRRRFYEKPSDKATREKTESIRRRRKLARKQAIRDGLIAAPAKKPTVRSDGGRGSSANTAAPSLRGAAKS
jgi:small subunit ribosomal protein S21